MKKLLLLVLFLGCISVSYAQDYVFNCRLANDTDVKIVDNINRRIIHTGDNIVFENYSPNSEYEKDLKLHIDSIVSKSMAFEKFKRDWYYCTSDFKFKYIVIGLGSANVDLYQICSEVEIYKEIFSSLK